MTLQRSRARGREFSLVELLIASSVLVIGIFGVLGALTAQAQTRMFSNENEFAAHLLQDVLSEYHALSTTAVVQEIYDHPDLTDTLTSERVVVSLTARILSEREASTVFRVDLDGDGDPDLYDLDRDGTPGEDITFDPTSDEARDEHLKYQIVPIELTMVWRDSSGQERERTIHTMVYDLDVQ